MIRSRSRKLALRCAIGCGGVLLLAACGESAAESVSAPPVGVTTPSVEAPPVEPTEAPGGPTTDAVVDTAPTATAGGDSDPAPLATQAPTVEPPALGGRVLAAELDPESASAGNPLPDVVVDDVGRNTRANVANLLPSDRPVLIWAWAPH